MEPAILRKYLIYFTDSYVISVAADDWKVRDGKFLIFYINKQEVGMYNFNNIYGFCELSRENDGRRV